MSDTATTEREPEAPPEDIRSALRAAMEAQTDAPETPQREAPVESTPEPASREGAPERARGPDGKFIRADAEAEDASPKPAADPATQQQPTPAGSDSPNTDGPAGKEPPQNWRAADKELFKTLPAPAQDFMLRRHTEMEADYTRKTQQLAQLRTDYEPVAQMFAPHSDQLRARGLTPASLIQAWANVEQRLMGGDGVNVVRSLVDGYKIPVDQLMAALGYRAPATTASGDQQPPPPEAPAIHPQIAQELAVQRQWIQGEVQRQQYAQQQARAFEANRISNDIDQFRSAVDSAGQPLHPYFADVEHDMAALVRGYQGQGMPVPPLSELYDRAVYSNPSTRAALQQSQAAAAEAQRQAAEAKAKADARAKAESARRAGSSVTGAPGGAPPATTRRGADGSIRDALRAAMEDQAV